MPEEKEINASTETVNALNEILQNPENLITVIAKAEELSEALLDVPAQIQLLARATLAGNFIVTKPDGTKDFKAKAFEAVWNYLTADETKPESSEATA